MEATLEQINENIKGCECSVRRYRDAIEEASRQEGCRTSNVDEMRAWFEDEKEQLELLEEQRLLIIEILSSERGAKEEDTQTEPSMEPAVLAMLAEQVGERVVEKHRRRTTRRRRCTYGAVADNRSTMNATVSQSSGISVLDAIPQRGLCCPAISVYTAKKSLRLAGMLWIGWRLPVWSSTNMLI